MSQEDDLRHIGVLLEQLLDADKATKEMLADVARVADIRALDQRLGDVETSVSNLTSAVRDVLSEQPGLIDKVEEHDWAIRQLKAARNS